MMPHLLLAHGSGGKEELQGCSVYFGTAISDTSDTNADFLRRSAHRHFSHHIEAHCSCVGKKAFATTRLQCLKTLATTRNAHAPSHGLGSPHTLIHGILSQGFACYTKIPSV